jgi:signal transduction histidine kinase
VGYRGMDRDITDLKRIEKEKLLLEEQFRQRQKIESIGTLAGGIAHDFNNILSSLMGYVELALLDVEEGSEASRNLEQSLKAARRAKELVKQILTLSRQEKKERKPPDLGSTIKKSLKLLRATLPATIQFQVAIQEGLDLIKGDATEISQILMNLCTNAAQAMGANGGMLEISLDPVKVDPSSDPHHRGIDPGPYLRLRVGDRGPGVPPQIPDKIFDPYFTTKEIGKGTGLGLAIVL